MARTTRKELDELVARLADRTGQPMTLEHRQPGDSRTPYVITCDRGGTYPLGARKRSAGELADCLRFALLTLSVVRPAQGATVMVNGFPTVDGVDAIDTLRLARQAKRTAPDVEIAVLLPAVV